MAGRRRIWTILAALILALLGTTMRPAPAMATGEPCPMAGHMPGDHPMHRSSGAPMAPCAICCAGCLPAPLPAEPVAIGPAVDIPLAHPAETAILPDGLDPTPDLTPPRARG